MNIQEITALRLSDLREEVDEDLHGILDDIREQLHTVRFQKVTDVVENPAVVREVRRVGARIRTILRERELTAAKMGDSAT